MSPRLEECDRKQLELEAYSIPPQIVEELIIQVFENVDIIVSPVKRRML